MDVSLRKPLTVYKQTLTESGFNQRGERMQPQGTQLLDLYIVIRWWLMIKLTVFGTLVYEILSPNCL